MLSFNFTSNHDLVTSDFPFHKLTDPEIAGDPVCSPKITGNVTGFVFPDGDPPDHPQFTTTGGAFTACDAANIISDTDDVASSMGVHFGLFGDIPAGTGTGLTLNNTAGVAPVSPFGPASLTGVVRALIHDKRSSVALGATPAHAAIANIDPIAGVAGTGGPTRPNQFPRG